MAATVTVWAAQSRPWTADRILSVFTWEGRNRRGVAGSVRAQRDEIARIEGSTITVLRVLRIVVLVAVAVDATDSLIRMVTAEQITRAMVEAVAHNALGLGALIAVLWFRPWAAAVLGAAVLGIAVWRDRLIGIESMLLTIAVIVATAIVRRFVLPLVALGAGALVTLGWVHFGDSTVSQTQAVSVVAAFAVGLAGRGWLSQQRATAQRLRAMEERTQDMRTRIRAELAGDIRRVVEDYLARSDRALASLPNGPVPAQHLRATLDIVDDDARRAISALRTALGVLRAGGEDAETPGRPQGAALPLGVRIVEWTTSFPARIAPAILAAAIAFRALPSSASVGAVATIGAATLALGVIGWPAGRAAVLPVALLAAAVHPSPLWAVLIAVAIVGLSAGWRGTLTSVAVGAVGIAVTSALWLIRAEAVPVTTIVGAVSIAVVATVIGLVAGNQTRFAQTSVRHAQRVAQEQAGLRRAEREQLARDLHDVVGHDLTRITVRSLGVSGSHNVAELRCALADIRKVNEQARASLEHLVVSLGPDVIDPSVSDATGMTRPAVALDRLRATLEQAGHRVSGDIDPTIDTLDEMWWPTLTRIGTEMVTNVLRHAPRCSGVEIRARVADERVVMVVSNELGGATAGINHGVGLLGMQERARAVGGSVVSARDRDQWRAEARIPVRLHSGRP